MSAVHRLAYAAGVYEQSLATPTGWITVEWSRHTTLALAQRAARRYARAQRGRSSGGAMAWSAWYAPTGGDPIEVSASTELFARMVAPRSSARAK